MVVGLSLLSEVNDNDEADESAGGGVAMTNNEKPGRLEMTSGV